MSRRNRDTWSHPPASGSYIVAEGYTGWAGGMLAAPAPVVRQTKVKRGRGQKNKNMKEKGEIPQHHAGGLVGLQKILSNKKGSLSATHKKNSEANTRVYDLNQKITAALGNVAVIYKTFEEAGGNLEGESAKGETPYHNENTAMEDLVKALQQRDRLQDELRGFQEKTWTAPTWKSTSAGTS